MVTEISIIADIVEDLNLLQIVKLERVNRKECMRMPLMGLFVRDDGR